MIRKKSLRCSIVSRDRFSRGIGLKVMADASFLITSATIKAWSLLPQLFSDVFIPEVVYAEESYEGTLFAQSILTFRGRCVGFPDSSAHDYSEAKSRSHRL